MQLGVDLFEPVLLLVEFFPHILALCIVLAALLRPSLRRLALCAIPAFAVLAIAGTVIASYRAAAARGFDLTRPSLRAALEDYIQTGKGDLHDILESGKYAPVFGRHELWYLVTQLIGSTVLHLDAHNAANIPVSYNKGNDWFRATLGEPMVYTSGIYKNGNETLMQAQRYKLDYVANAIGLQKRDKVLDIGCGWGTLVNYFTQQYDATVTGITLSEEQLKYFEQTHKPKMKVTQTSKVLLQDAMKMLERKDLPKNGFDKIVALEMAEHVGIRRYAEFLSIVKQLLKDDGVFYIQVAGLRRDWDWEDFVWGLFMGEHIFPGADASCPIGWVTTQLERAGFEVQRVNNLGTHYSRTLKQWLDEWHLDRDNMINKYGEVAYRRWEVFLAWSVRIARQGSSTVFMITTTKAKQTDTRVAVQKQIVPVWSNEAGNVLF